MEERIIALLAKWRVGGFENKIDCQEDLFDLLKAGNYLDTMECLMEAMKRLQDGSR